MAVVTGISSPVSIASANNIYELENYVYQHLMLKEWFVNGSVKMWFYYPRLLLLHGVLG